MHFELQLKQAILDKASLHTNRNEHRTLPHPNLLRATGLQISLNEAYEISEMSTPSGKRQRREDYLAQQREDGGAEMPKKRFYRQRAHANPFSDHNLV